MPTTKQIEFINKKKFDKVALDENIKAFVIYVTFFSLKELTMIIHLVKEAQIALLLAKKVKILTKYSDFSDVFSEEKALVLPKLTNFN